MQKKFILNLALVLFLNILIKPIWIFGIDREVQNQVGAAEYGVYFALFNFSFLLNILLDCGITNFNNKNIAQNNHLLTKHFSSLVSLKFILAVAYLIITLIAGLIIGYNIQFTKLLLIFAFNQFLISFTLYLRSNIAGLHLFKTDSLISVLDRLIMIPICGILLWTNIFHVKMTIMVFVYTQTAAYFFTALITFFIVAAKTHTFKLTFNWPFSIMILKQSIPFAILVLLMTFYNRIDTVMLERLLPRSSEVDQLGISGSVQTGIYAQAYRLLDATNMIAFLFAGLLLPIFSRMLKYKESVEQLVKLSYSLLLTPAIIVAIGCSFYSHEIMQTLYREHTDQSGPVFSVLMFCFVAVSTTYIFGTLLTANGNLKELNLMAASGMVLNIALNFLLIPRLFALGSAIAAMSTQLVMALAQVLIVQRKFQFKINYRLLFTITIYALGVMGISWATHNYSFNPQKWVISFLVMVIFSILWAFISRLISIKSLFRMVKYG